ncbi:MAG: bifunctional alpha,alpha-trehalose-phosphate synthase (UDP-forming)/trehalose-phosphatase [bacterium]|nr:bifunctional alpha,alpha-trehalose-phosphate synthase (UDP-forming)/trehalose-phosphatase [bacterium]
MRLFIVSNRLPFTVTEKEGKIGFERSAGGLITGISDYLNSLKDSSFTKIEYIWTGWPGIAIGKNLQNEVKQRCLAEFSAYPVFISNKNMENFYHGFCNKTIWPLFHCFPAYTVYDEDFWDSYRQTNEEFLNTIVNILEPEDILWIHDYHLMLLPKLLRERMPEVSIGFFLHIPFPPYDIFRLLPNTWRIEILEGLLGADLIGFHTIEYTQNFLRCVLRLSGYDNNIGEINTGERMLKADTFPMGINFEKFFAAQDNIQIQKEIKNLKEHFGGKKIILSVDRLDYTKGILNRLEGYELFLEKNPNWHKKVVMLLIVVPSRIGVESYAKTKNKIDEIVGKINGRFGTIEWTPIQYQYKNLPFEQLTALYALSDIALITPLRDGMNLIAKEYVSTKRDKKGVLILSEMAGAAKELAEAIIINPNHKGEIARALEEAVEMSCQEQIRRNEIMQKRLSDYNVIRWAGDFIQELKEVVEQRKRFETKLLSFSEEKVLLRDFKKAQSKIIFLDYDGTLAGFAKDPQEAMPDEEIIRLLKLINEYPQTRVILTSGRDRETLTNWFGRLNIGLIAEHGVWIKEKDLDWQLIKPLGNDWKPRLLSLSRVYVDRLPGSFIEEKEFSLVWHYREADPELGSLRAKELVDDLISLTANIGLQILQGNRVVEIRNSGVNKGAAASYLLAGNKYDFVLAIGDDWTDEDLFKILPQQAYSIKVGIGSSYARYNLMNYKEVLRFLKEMVE